jgi:hypothetical protein
MKLLLPQRVLLLVLLLVVLLLVEGTLISQQTSS